MSEVPHNITLVMKQPIWFAGLALNIVVIFLHTYLACNFLIYVVRTRRKKILAKRPNSNGGVRIQNCAVAAVVLPYFSYAVTQGIVWVSLDYTSIIVCNALRVFSVVAYVLAITLCYIFLWLRQRLFYSHPLLTPAFRPCVNKLSWATLVMNIAAGSVEVCVSIILPYALNNDKLTRAPHGCEGRSRDHNWFQLPFLYGCALFALQGLLVGLFVYPLCLYNKERSKSEKISLQLLRNGGAIYLGSYGTLGANDGDFENGENTGEGNELPSWQKGKSSVRDEMRSIILKNASLAAVWMFSDVIAMAMAGFLLQWDDPQILTFAVYDLSLLVNAVAVVASFSEWKQILVPCGRSNSEK